MSRFYYYRRYLVTPVINSSLDIPFLSLFGKDKTIELASEHLPFALSLTGSKYLNNDMLTIRNTV